MTLENLMKLINKKYKNFKIKNEHFKITINKKSITVSDTKKSLVSIKGRRDT